MEALFKIAKRALKLDIDEIMFDILNREEDVIDLIVMLNTEGQLFQGVDSNNRELAQIGGGYAPITIQIKQADGQPTNRVTLKDRGDFYDSFEVIIKKDGFIIDADTLKEGIDLRERWGANIIGLNDISKEALIFFLQPLVIEYVINFLLQDN